MNTDYLGCKRCQDVQVIPSWFINISRERDFKPPLEEIQPYYGVSKCPNCGTYFNSDRDYAHPFMEKVYAINFKQALELLKTEHTIIDSVKQRTAKEIEYIENELKKKFIPPIKCSICKNFKDYEQDNYGAGRSFLPAPKYFYDALEKFRLIAERPGFSTKTFYQCPECGTYYLLWDDESMYGSGGNDSLKLFRIKLDKKHRDVMKEVKEDILLDENNDQRCTNAELKEIVKKFDKFIDN